jgi:signal peptidase I
LSKPQFDSPHINDHKAGDLNLSNDALLSLMRAVLEKGLPFRFRARGWSMSPFIKDGDVITVCPLMDRQPGLGDVIAFTHPVKNRIIVHRVIGKDGAGLKIHGDSVEDNSDEIIPPENLLGKVTEVNRDGKKVWLGLGMERQIIAWLSRLGLLVPIYQWLASAHNRIKRKQL